MIEGHETQVDRRGPIMATETRAPGRSLGIEASDLGGVTRQIEAGLPYEAYVRFRDFSQLLEEQIAVAARCTPTSQLTPEQSDKIVRLALVFERAVDLFDGNHAAAKSWMTSPNRALGNETPLAVTRTSYGANAVNDLIGQLEHGIFS